MGWSEAQFWGSTLIGTFRATDGFAEFHGTKPPPAPTKSKVDEMLLKYPDPPKGRRV